MKISMKNIFKNNYSVFKVLKQLYKLDAKLIIIFEK